MTTLQVNLGYLCNQACVHCHVNAGPKRTELMKQDTVEAVLAFLRAKPQVRTLDLTGGAPEMNPHFRHLVDSARELGLRVVDRCNLTILEEPGYEDLADFLANRRVEIVASLPCYLEDNVDRQRGNGVFAASTQSAADVLASPRRPAPGPARDGPPGGGLPGLGRGEPARAAHQLPGDVVSRLPRGRASDALRDK